MGYRRKDARPRVALWMLVALGDIVLLLASVGLPLLVALLSVVTITLGAVAARRITRRGVVVGSTAPVATRRRA